LAFGVYGKEEKKLTEQKSALGEPFFFLPEPISVQFADSEELGALTLGLFRPTVKALLSLSHWFFETPSLESFPRFLIFPF